MLLRLGEAALSWRSLTFPFLVVQLVLLHPSPVDAIDFQHWQCGSEKESKTLAHNLIHKDCPQLAGELNHCCVIHDDCYTKQRGQELCDREFCLCNKKALKGKNFEKCEDHNQLVCFMMPLLGTFAYKNSENWTDPEHTVYYRPPGDLYPVIDGLYEACSDVPAILSSCSYNYIDCALGTRGVSACGEELAQCLESSSKESQSAQCAVESKRVAATVRTETYRRFDWTNAEHVHMLKNAFLVLVSLVCLLCILWAGWTWWRRVILLRRSDSEGSSIDQIKYQSV